MTTSLAPAPNMEQLKKQSKDLLRAFRAGDPTAAERFQQHHPEYGVIPLERLTRLPLQLADAQLAIARAYGFPSWPKLKAEVERINREAGKPVVQKAKVRHENGRVWIEGVRNLGWGRDRENTFCGALEMALASTEHPYSYSDLMGYSGLAFRTRWFQGNAAPDVCPSSPVGEFPEELAAISRATGWPIWTGNRLGEDDADKSMAPYWQEVMSSVDDGRPMLAYNLKMDVGIIHGYIEQDRRIVGWDYHHPGEEPLTLPIEKMGPWIGFIDANEGPQPAKDAFSQSLGIAIANFRRDTFDKTRSRGDYRHGAIALTSWANDLLHASPDQGDYYASLFFVSWWTFNSLFDARMTAPAFLREHADLLGDEPSGLVRQAANLYGEEIELLVRTFRERDIFFGPWTGKKVEDWTEEVRRQEHDLLLSALAIEEKAIALLENAVELNRSASAR